MTKRDDQKMRRKIRAAMTRQGRKWAWLSERTHYSKTHITDMVHGRAPLSPKFVEMAKHALGLTDLVA